MDIRDYLIETADQCAHIAKTGRILVERFNTMVRSEAATPLSSLSAGGVDLSERVDQIAQSLLAKAVEIDHERQKNEQNRS